MTSKRGARVSCRRHGGTAGLARRWATPAHGQAGGAGVRGPHHVVASREAGALGGQHADERAFAHRSVACGDRKSGGERRKRREEGSEGGVSASRRQVFGSLHVAAGRLCRCCGTAGREAPRRQRHCRRRFFLSLGAETPRHAPQTATLHFSTVSMSVTFMAAAAAAGTAAPGARCGRSGLLRDDYRRSPVPLFLRLPKASGVFVYSVAMYNWVRARGSKSCEREVGLWVRASSKASPRRRRPRQGRSLC